MISCASLTKELRRKLHATSSIMSATLSRKSFVSIHAYKDRMESNMKCAICGGPCSLLDVVDFNKSCEEARGKYLGLSGIPIYYAICNNCGFCFSPDMANWEKREFQDRVYNDDYVEVDPDYVDARPKANVAQLISMFGERGTSIRHLDYGGGNGQLSRMLNDNGWQSRTYDPFVNSGLPIDQIGKFDLITAFEVFEHVPDVQELLSNLRTLLAPRGVILFTTLLSDGHITPGKRLSWWYASPRNGHISLFSRMALKQAAQRYNVKFGSFSEGFHMFFTDVPVWAQHLFRAPNA
jgi:SAM-dependent methyltransferase